MSASVLINKIKEVFGDRVNYRPYNIKSTTILFGTPPVPVKGLHYIWAQHNQPQTKRIMGLTSKGVFVPNNNGSGIVEIGMMSGTVSSAGFEVLEFTGIPFPLFATDRDTGGTSTILASACRRVATPRWKREALLGISIFTLATDRLMMSDGLRLVE